MILNLFRYPLVLGLLCKSFVLHADTLVVPYSSFYTHIKKIAGEETNALQFAFGFKQLQTSQLCTISSAFIQTQKQTIPLTLIHQQRFTVPSDKVLKLARADVVLELEQAANRCDMSVQLETKPEYLKSVYSQDELHELLRQYQAFFNSMGSFLSFMMPEVQGLQLHFTDESQLSSLPQGLSLERGVLRLPSQWIADNKGLQLGVSPLRITSQTVK